MNEEFLNFYRQELQFIRESGAEFATNYPDIASGLSLQADRAEPCADPYIERLLEGFAFLSAGIQHKMQARFPILTQHLLEIIYPHFLAPLPSMSIAQFTPKSGDTNMLEGPEIERGTRINSVIPDDDSTPLTYSTAHHVRCWPLNVSVAEVVATRAELEQQSTAPVPPLVCSAIRLRLEMQVSAPISALQTLDELSFYLQGNHELCYTLYEYVFRHAVTVGIQFRGEKDECLWLDKDTVHSQGFTEEEALLPVTERSFSGYRLLQEYFAFPQRFRFFKLTQLQAGIEKCHGQNVDLIIGFNREMDEPGLQHIDASCFQLHCTPVINLFNKAIDPIALHDKKAEYHIALDRTRSADFELFSLSDVTGFSKGERQQQTFYPLYHPAAANQPHAGYYTLKRHSRPLSQRQRHGGMRSPYLGSEVFINISDSQNPPYRHDLMHLQFKALCTNRDLPRLYPHLQFQYDDTLPVSQIRNLAQPSMPVAAQYYGKRGWELIRHLSLNYLTLLASHDDNNDAIAKATGTLQQMLQLYARGESGLTKKIQAIEQLVTCPKHYRLPIPGPITYVQGQELHLQMNESAFVGDSAFLFAQVLNTFFQHHTSVHSLSGMRLFSSQRGELHQWMPEIGLRKPC